VQLALPWAAGRDPSGFLVSEKFDGVRALWDCQPKVEMSPDWPK
jgi:ATP-dependent DNA ligase